MQIIVRRGTKFIVHQICQMFSMQHCIYYHCRMNGSATNEQQDLSPMHLCPVCLRKIMVNEMNLCFSFFFVCFSFCCFLVLSFLFPIFFFFLFFFFCFFLFCFFLFCFSLFFYIFLVSTQSIDTLPLTQKQITHQNFQNFFFIFLKGFMWHSHDTKSN